MSGKGLCGTDLAIAITVETVGTERGMGMISDTLSMFVGDDMRVM